MSNVIPMIRSRAERVAAQVAFDAQQRGLDSAKVETFARTAYQMVYEDRVSGARTVRECGRLMCGDDFPKGAA